MSSAAMASSSVSQDDVDNDFEKSSRRSRIRMARGRDVRCQQTAAGRLAADSVAEAEDAGDSRPPDASGYSGDHDASPKPAARAKDKRPVRPSHINKGKQQRDRRKLREKRRSTGVVHMPSTEVSSTGGSTNEDDEELSTGQVMCNETRRNTQQNEFSDPRGNASSLGISHADRQFKNPLRNKSLSDLDADDEDNQDCDSLGMSDTPLLTTGHPPRPLERTPERPADRVLKLEEENERLRRALAERDQRIAGLEAALGRSRDEKHQLRLENDALIKAMEALTAK